MALTNTNALVSIQDGAGAVNNIASGATAQVTAGGVMTVSLQSTTGVNRWEFSFNCPSYPGLHQTSRTWLPGMANAFAIPLPASAFSGTNPLSGIQFISTVGDNIQSIGTVIGWISARGTPSVPAQHWVRAVINSALGAYTNTGGVLTANANGAIGSVFDGVTGAVGDAVLLPNGIAASGVDAGIYYLTALGGASAKFVLTAAPDWPVGGIVLPKTEVLVGPEGTLYGGTTWVVTNSGLTNAINTASFTFYPRMVSQSITLVAGTKTITNVPILSATAVSMTFTRTTANTTASTITYQPVGTITVGALGTVTFAFDATVAAGTLNNADISTGSLAIWNQV